MAPKEPNPLNEVWKSKKFYTAFGWAAFCVILAYKADTHAAIHLMWMATLSLVFYVGGLSFIDGQKKRP